MSMQSKAPDHSTPTAPWRPLQTGALGFVRPGSAGEAVRLRRVRGVSAPALVRSSIRRDRRTRLGLTSYRRSHRVCGASTHPQKSSLGCDGLKYGPCVQPLLEIRH
jgi:hypothetical protein